MVLWPEGSVSSVNADSVQPRQRSIGEECIVTVGKKKIEHKATIVARGELKLYKVYAITCSK